MSEGVTRLRQLPDRVVDLRSPADRIIELQKALSAELGLLESEVAQNARSLLDQLESAQGYALSAGVREEHRKMAQELKGSLQRLEAIRGRA